MKRAIAIAIGIIIAFGLVELTAWLGLWGQIPEEAHPIWHHKLRPNRVTRIKSPMGEWQPVTLLTNSLGLRDHREFGPKRSGEYRLLVLGDSFVEARQMPATSTTVWLLERALGVTAINCGVSGYSPALERLWFTRAGVRLEPDSVILCWFYNDLLNDYWRHRVTVYSESGVPLRVPPPTYPWWMPHTLRILKRKPLRAHWAACPYLTAPEDNALAMFKPPRALLPKEREFLEACWRRSLDHLSTIAYACQELDVEFRLVIIPEPPQVGPNEWVAGKTRLGLTPSAVIRSRDMQDRLCAWAAGANVPCVDLLPAFQASSSQSLFLDWDGHLTAHGHRVAASEILSSLLRDHQ